MKSLFTLVIIVSVSLKLNAQDVKEYFLPAPEYFDNTFEYEGSIITNNAGEYQTKKSMQYFKRSDENIKTYTIQAQYRYNSLESSLATHMFYHLKKERVVKTGHYVEGVSDYLKKNGWIDNFESNDILLKAPNSSWKQSLEDGETIYYNSRASNVSTKTAHYDKVIEISQYTDVPSMPNFKKMVIKAYYAYNIGLVKTEQYYEGKLDEERTVELIDNFSPYSFYQKEKLSEINALKEKIKTCTYSYDSVAPESHNEAVFQINKRLSDICQKQSKSYLDIAFEVKFFIDSLGNVAYSKIKGLRDNTEAEQEIEKFLGSFTLPAGEIEGIKCNTKFLLSFEMSYAKGTTNVEISNKAIKYLRDTPPSFVLDLLTSRLEHTPSGRFTINYNVGKVNNESFARISIDNIEGEIKVKVRKGKAKVKDKSLSADVQFTITENMKNEKNGKYKVKYNIGEKDDKIYVDLEKKKIRSTGAKILRAGGIILLVGLLL